MSTYRTRLWNHLGTISTILLLLGPMMLGVYGVKVFLRGIGTGVPTAAQVTL
jgi:hypothetical protein